MKKILSIFLILILMISTCSVAVSAWEMVDFMRIGIYYGTNARAEYTLTSETGFDLGYYDGREFISEVETYDTQMRIVKGAGSYLSVLNLGTGETLYSFDTVNYGLGVVPKEKDSGEQMMKITAKATTTYRGGFDFKSVSNGITAVNVVELDDYLYGVISREMSPSWPKEALKAQAVCARNFALSKLGRHKDSGFDLCNTVCCQAYSGVDYEAAGSYAPVDETSKEVLLYEDELVQAVYSSSMGECTEDVKNVWGSKVPYLVSVSNEYEDTANVNNGIWENTLSKARATEIMNSKGYNIGTVTDITALEYSEAGRVLRLEVKGTKGSEIFTKERCRTIFAEATLSQMYTISGGGKVSYPVVYTLGAKGKQSVSLDKVYVLGAEGETSFYAVSDKTTQKLEGATMGDDFIFSGQGWGHGVGMSQYGAKGMAEAGFTYDEILTHYYDGTHLERFYTEEEETTDEIEEVTDGLGDE
ncbi:MAG: SpoIID/LytB domain-containing protein [Clostridia bacterium]|nr:SpoIID/LytB domain-containing protein [Clostridia bacterium]